MKTFYHENSYLMAKCIKPEFIKKAKDDEYNARVKMQRTMPVLILEKDDIDESKTERIFETKLHFIGMLFGLKMYSRYDFIPRYLEIF